MWQQIGSSPIFKTRAIGNFPRKYLQKFARNYVTLSIDLFASRISYSTFYNPSQHDLEARSGKSGNQCHVSTMAKNVPICLYPIQPNTLGIIKAKQRRDHNDIGGTNMAITSMVFSSSEHLFPQSISLPHRKDLLLDPFRKSHRLIVNQTLGGLVGFRRSLASKGISDKAAKLILDSRGEISISSYELAWRQWAGWCGKRKVDPFRCSLKFVRDCLSDLFEKGLAYRTINVHRSAIWAYHEPLHGFPIGQLPLVCSLLSGVFNHRAPQPRYPFIWDV